jgi:hypothetical protein
MYLLAGQLFDGAASKLYFVRSIYSGVFQNQLAAISVLLHRHRRRWSIRDGYYLSAVYVENSFNACECERLCSKLRL